jgi:hypothetical protein
MDKSQIECQERLSKIHVAIDIKKKWILSLKVTSEEVYDGNLDFIHNTIYVIVIFDLSEE